MRAGHIFLGMGRRRILADNRIGIAYVRVSTEDQKLGPEAQRDAIVAWAAREGVQIAAWHVDAGVSGATPIEQRPGLVAALESVREHRAGVLVVAKRDRLARDVVIAAMVERTAALCGARVVSADGTGNGDSPADAFMRTILDGASAYERAMIRARTRAALASKKARGERVGTVPFGYRLAADGVHVEQDDEEQRVIVSILTLHRDGRSVRAIASELLRRGVVGRTGRPLSHAQVHRVLRAA